MAFRPIGSSGPTPITLPQNGRTLFRVSPAIPLFVEFPYLFKLFLAHAFYEPLVPHVGLEVLLHEARRKAPGPPRASLRA